jgi:hypothetical protein
MLSTKLTQIAVSFAKGETVDCNPQVTEMMNFCMSDVNSSALRELITLEIAGYKSLPGKLGRDGVDSTGREVECKPKSYNGKTAQRGGACFNDYTRNRFNVDLEYGLDIVASLFDGKRCLYVVEYNINAIKDKLDKQITEKCEVESNAYVRSASWAYDSYINDNSLKVHYIDTEYIVNNPKCMVKPFRETLLSKCDT